MVASAPVARVLHRLAAGEALLAACQAEAVVVARDVRVDAHYDGKPVCTVTLPWVVDGHALLSPDETIAPAVAADRLHSLAAALTMPVCILRAPLTV